ncbi:MAG: hypothetical protein V4544_07350 [Pseudomonadota bacterium]
MTLKFRKLRALSILSLQLFCFWLAVGYVSCLFIVSIPATASDFTHNFSFALPHGQLFLYAEITTVISVALALLILHVQQKTSKMKLIRLYRPRNLNNQKKSMISKP